MNKKLDNKGMIYIDFVIGFFGIMMCIAFALAVLPIFTVNNKLENSAETLMRLSEMSGHTSFDLKIEELKTDQNIDFTVNWEGTEYIGSTKKVQLNDDIHIKLTTTVDIGFFTFGSFPVEVGANLIGTSEVYHK